MRFEWHPDERPPEIESSSKAKLEVFRTYLSAYIERLNVGFRRDVFKLDLVDGFAGGGTFRDGEDHIRDAIDHAGRGGQGRETRQ